ncbi:MAG: NAD(+) synthase [Oscillospiraceae bacterium]
MKDGFIKVAAGTPNIKVADCRYNAEACFTLMREAYRQDVRILVLPELCLTGATCGDLFLQDTLQRGALEGLDLVLEATRGLDMLAVIGLPLLRKGRLYNCAAVLHKGVLLGVVAKRELTPAQTRWFTPGDEIQPIFRCETMENLVLGITFDGETAPEAVVNLNLTAQNELVGRAEGRRAQIAAQSARLSCGMVCAAAGQGESSTDGVFGGHNFIAENGKILAERRFAVGLTLSELDVNRLAFARRQASAGQPDCGDTPAISFSLEPADTELTRHISKTPFIPEDPEKLQKRCDEILLLAALGLKTRLEHTGAKACVVGLSGGLDSTLAILITALALRLAHRPASDILAVTMPCFGTTDRTRDNAVLLAERLGATLKRIDISATVTSHFKDIAQPQNRHDAAFENAQARERTQVLMDLANQCGGLVIGTGDLSELALGWCTYNGDHMSGYAVCADIPKTLVRQLVSFVSFDKQGEDKKLSAVLDDILDTPISPELLPAIEGAIAQKTEDLVGPYQLHDFFLYYALRWGFSPAKILRLAEHAFGGSYSRKELLKWETLFFRRFFSQQFKRSCLPDGPQVGSVTLSPRGGYVMPSDAAAALWLAELETL